MKRVADVLIVGSGVAGLYASLNLREDLEIIMVSKKSVNLCNSSLAQGGIAVARGKEDFQSFIEDTLKAGKYENNIDSVRVLVEESMDNINKLIDLGANFEKDENGVLFTKEGAHEINRIVYHKDITGKHVEDILLENVKRRKNIKIIEDCEMVDIYHRGNRCIGALFNKDGQDLSIYAKVVILATGGIGGLFKKSTNERIITGDSIGVAIRNNIEIKDLSYIQIHPTAFFSKKSEEKRFLISESVRGEGGKLLNCNGERFVDELLPRDIVSKKIYEEMKKTNSNNVFLDVSFMEKSFLQNRFPNIYNKCLEEGIDISKEPIPVAPAQHYFMGGIKVDLNGKTSMENLYAFGETSCTGVHGANRLASNSLLEALVFSRRGALEINSYIDNLELIIEERECEDLDKYRLLNRKILIDEICRLRGDIKDELVTCGGECKKSS
ncbi:L-aspartate oxidase [Clostridium perfringens]|uniref:L-aspartate oxidase n=2 Tax=Clostridium perfringens TaxID=1502 RepID=NADB_CLOPE|nr:L-aspartate oxidase [Clostridium perfringens]Q8XNE2.1 RecName: Full=L-aspartate oxidase; Short=LASPO; AltName: Full=Quinolinate synthase B [Clostridium perfringens str. 13]EDT78903.1 L-aspartate oxidase [Clostridium perfringens NCTC 8239]EHA0993424.1 L-aspartate oxidase [Clostridium perfringens]EHA1184431.1 L-aspartate oxidase [Clostridium perfringens]EHK2427580.1 L-aspartate oxidase [Clostridium perfringens]EHR1327811.1 L-aspartate oxidase [Clostridium perfringens]